MLLRTRKTRTNTATITALLLPCAGLVMACGDEGATAGTQPTQSSSSTAVVPSVVTPVPPPGGTTVTPTVSPSTPLPVSPTGPAPVTPPPVTPSVVVPPTTTGAPPPVPTGSTVETSSPTSGTTDTSTEVPTEPSDTATDPEVPPGDDELDSLACGAKYTAIGDGGWILCVRLADGGGACSDKGTATFHRVTFSDGSPIDNVAQVSGFGDTSVGVVTTDGALYTGVGPTGINKSPAIAEGVVNFSGGYHSRVALTKTGGKFGVVGWVDTGNPAAIALPADVNPVQVSGNYGLACALASTGDVYCWEAGGNHNITSITTTPSKVTLDGPVRQVSVGQNTVCGVTFDDKLTCVAAWYDNPWLPSEGQAPNFTVKQSTFPEVREVHAGFHQGVIVDGSGVAHFLDGNGSPGTDNPGSPFTGVSDVVAAGGDRGNACVANAAGELHCWVSGATRATLDGQPVQVQAADCPF